MKRLMGGEIEYGLTATDAHGVAIDQARLLKRFIDFARGTLPYTSESTNGRFLSNGGLLYLDHGLHVEWATPECTSPHDVVRFLRAGDSTMARLLDEWPRTSPELHNIFCTRCNVAYASKVLWASHESYLHYSPPEQLPTQLVPFLTTRLIVAGAGGWNVDSPGLSFTLSPRAHAITEVMNADTQHIRPIFHTKQESLSRTGSKRLHVSCSESLCSDKATLLRFGSTALVVAVLDLGARPWSDLALQKPVAALRTLADDPSCRAKVTLTDGREWTAIQIQRHYLAQVERHVDAGELPSWAPAICLLWRETLDDLEYARGGAALALDWAIKRTLYGRWLERQGLSWDAVELWNPIVDRLYRNWRAVGHEPSAFDLEALTGCAPRMTASIARCRWLADKQGLDWNQLAAFARSRKQLFELDMRFGAIGGQGVFESLDQARVLTHRVNGLDTTTPAENPPSDTRAHVRGTVIKRLSEANVRYGAEWTAIYDYDHQRELDLGDPFELQERWLDRSKRRGDRPTQTPVC